jgi:hypothetical protein
MSLAHELFGDAAELLRAELLPRVCEENVRRVFERSKIRSAELGIEGATFTLQ